MVRFLQALFFPMALLAGFCALVLYTPTFILDTVDQIISVEPLHTLRSAYGGPCAKVLQQAGAMALTAGIGWLLLNWITAGRRQSRKKKHRLAVLQQTSSEQRHYLRAFMEQKQPIDYPLLDANAQELRRGEILSVLQDGGGNLCVQPHVLAPWARKLLKRNPELLEIDQGAVERQGQGEEGVKIERPFRHSIAV